MEQARAREILLYECSVQIVSPVENFLELAPKITDGACCLAAGSKERKQRPQQQPKEQRIGLAFIPRRCRDP